MYVIMTHGVICFSGCQCNIKIRYLGIKSLVMCHHRLSSQSRNPQRQSYGHSDLLDDNIPAVKHVVSWSLCLITYDSLSFLFYYHLF